ncbi:MULTISPECIES: alpha/beta hydrolase [Streptomyces]|uniref:Alpha/beta hydrolase n=1 Tax=Streptomyces fuscus TaxID=3048495 RepID=A0ABT7J087_9ACTN|nr:MULTISPECIES: alpha/beta hydrolase [Streptomyces]MCM1972439.1 alpha/beta hydrolase [Streptomyces sp. G1]MDL2078258.1 alpha/beta hydrolase [Streptomyces fuscus]SBT90004.1 acetyl esterase [Streptomyces sp. DI166]
MPLHPEIAKVLAGLPAPPPGPLEPAAMRAAEEADVPPAEERLPLHTVEDLTADTDAGDVPVRVYTPTDAEQHGLLVYFHGGAFFLGSLETHDHIARALAKETGLKVVSVGYRRAPEAAYPAGLDDCYAVTRWVAGHGEKLGWDGATLAVAGDSSGGTFAAAVAARAHDDGFDRITHQILYYPSLDLDFDEDRYPSLRENAVGYGLETAGLRPFNSFYLNSGADPGDPLVSPIKRTDLTGLPPALIVTAEYDPLRDEGELYGRRLREAGVRATVSRYSGAGHGFVQHFSWLPAYQRVYAETREFLGRS